MTRREWVHAMASAPLLLAFSGRGRAMAERDALKELRRAALQVVEGSRVPPGAEVPGHGRNVTGRTLRLPGATQTFYPAFWVRDAAMMLGAGLVPAEEVEGWVRLIASTQAGPEGIRLKHGLFVPPFSIPDHITLRGTPCWYPGAFDGEDQGKGTFGFLPPADDAFYLIAMVREHLRLTGKPSLFRARAATPWGEAEVREICEKAFRSVDVDPETGLVRCEEGEGRTRVDWGFCDTVRKTGLALMPSLLRWQACRDLAALHRAAGRRRDSSSYVREAARIAASIPRTFAAPRGAREEERLLLSATGLGQKEDVWASAFAVWLGVLPADAARSIARRLLALYRAGGTVLEGQVRHLPPSGPLGGHWEQCVAAPDTYQNGAFWATPTGWYVSALRRVSRAAADRMLGEYLEHLRDHESRGAPWECINPAKDHYQNPRYAASAALPYAALRARSG